MTDADAVAAAAARLGIEFLPWQRHYLEAFLDPDTAAVYLRGRKHGWTTVQRVAQGIGKEERYVDQRVDRLQRGV